MEIENARLSCEEGDPSLHSKIEDELKGRKRRSEKVEVGERR